MTEVQFRVINVKTTSEAGSNMKLTVDMVAITNELAGKSSSFEGSKAVNEALEQLHFHKFNVFPERSERYIETMTYLEEHCDNDFSPLKIKKVIEELDKDNAFYCLEALADFLSEVANR